MKKKIENKIAAMRNSDKKGMEVLGWILTIVLTIAVVGIIWFFVQPAMSGAGEEAKETISSESTNVLNDAKANVSGAKTNPVGP